MSIVITDRPENMVASPQALLIWFTFSPMYNLQLQFWIFTFSIFEDATICMSMSAIVTNRSEYFGATWIALFGWFDALASSPMYDLEFWISTFSTGEEATICVSMSMIITNPG
jgi:hypothetical protein